MSDKKEVSDVTKNSQVNKFEKWMKYLGGPLAAAVFCLICFLPAPHGLKPEGQTSAAIFLGALVLWVSAPIPAYVTSLIALVFLLITGSRSEKSVLGVLGYDVIWLMITAFIITSGMEKSGAAKRMALFMVSRFENTAKKALLVMMFINSLPLLLYFISRGFPSGTLLRLF